LERADLPSGSSMSIPNECDETDGHTSISTVAATRRLYTT
jgi:hypothetical protein